MGDKSDAPAYLAAIGAALIVGAILLYLEPVIQFPAPGSSILLLFMAALCFAGAAAIKATEQRR